MVCNGDGLGSGLHVCVRAFSKPRQRGSQEPYQSTRPPCEMSSRSRRLWDCCRHPNSLWMSASLTGQLAYTALLTTQPHFQLLFFNSPPPPFLPGHSASQWQRRWQTQGLFWNAFTPPLRKRHVAYVAWRVEVNIGPSWRGILFCSRRHKQDLWNMQPNTPLSILTAEHSSFSHKSSAPPTHWACLIDV